MVLAAGPGICWFWLLVLAAGLAAGLGCWLVAGCLAAGLVAEALRLLVGCRSLIPHAGGGGFRFVGGWGSAGALAVGLGCWLVACC